MLPETYETLQNKIYGIFKDNLSGIPATEFSPDIELSLYDTDDLFLECIILDCIEVIEVPHELTYNGSALDKYFEYNQDDLLTIAKFADILIDIYIKYHTGLHRFHTLPADKQQQYYDQIYKIIQNNSSITPEVFSPDIIINIGKHAISGLKAKEMITQSSKAMGLNDKDVYKYFSDQKLFIFPMDLPGFILALLVSIISVINLIFYIIKWVITGKWNFDRFTGRISKPITAKEFADILINLWLVRCNDL